MSLGPIVSGYHTRTALGSIFDLLYAVKMCLVEQTYCRHAEPTRRKVVPSKAVRIRNTKKAAKLGDKAVPMLQAVKSTAVEQVIWHHQQPWQVDLPWRYTPGPRTIELTVFLPQTSLNGPQKMGEMPMNNMYKALVTFTIDPVV